MTLQEKHDLFLLRMDEANAPWFTVAERDVLLNDAQEAMCRDYYNEFEATERIRQGIAKLVEVLPITFVQTAHVGIANLDALVVPYAANGSKAMFVLSLIVEVTDNCGRTAKRAVKPHHSNKELQVTNDPFNRPTPREPKLHVEHDGTGSRRLRLYVADENATAPFPVIGANNTIRVLRSPRRMSLTSTPNVQCELPDFVHVEIVDRAVTRALENVESARLSGHTILSNSDTP